MFKLHLQLDQDCITIGDLSLSRVLLMNDAQYPWCILVPRRNEVMDIHQLSHEDQHQLIRESSLLSQIMMSLFQGRKMNVAALGNLVPQLHLHHIVRYEDDPCWPSPVWGQLPARSYEQDVLERVVEELKTLLDIDTI